MDYEFVKKDDVDERSEFANMVCQLVVDNCGRDINEALKSIKPFYDQFEIHVKNIYELIDSEIPLFSLYYLMKHGQENWGFTDEEYKDNKLKALKACVRYYRVSLASVVEWENKNI